MVFRVGLHWVMACLPGQTSRYIRISRLMTNEYSPDFLNIAQPLSVTLRRQPPSPPGAPVPQPPPPTEPPTSLLHRLAPQLRTMPRVVIPDPSALPLETRQPPRTLTVSVMIAMPTLPTLNPPNSSEDAIPPIQVGVTHIPIPHGWTTDQRPLSA